MATRVVRLATVRGRLSRRCAACQRTEARLALMQRAVARVLVCIEATPGRSDQIARIYGIPAGVLEEARQRVARDAAPTGGA